MEFWTGNRAVAAGRITIWCPALAIAVQSSFTAARWGVGRPPYANCWQKPACIVTRARCRAAPAPAFIPSRSTVRSPSLRRSWLAHCPCIRSDRSGDAARFSRNRRSSAGCVICPAWNSAIENDNQVDALPSDRIAPGRAAQIQPEGAHLVVSGQFEDLGGTTLLPTGNRG